MSPTQAPLRQLTFSVAAGAAAVLIGSDEGGKTTLMRLLAGHLIPTGGRVRVSGIDLRTSRLAASARVGYLPARVPDWGHMSVRDIVGFGARARGIAGNELEVRVDSVVESTGLAPRLGAAWSALDLAWQRQVAIALLLLQAPDTLLLDRVLDDLSPDGRARLIGRLLLLRERLTLFVSASTADLAALPWDRVLVLDAGQLSYDGAPAGLPLVARA